MRAFILVLILAFLTPSVPAETTESYPYAGGIALDASATPTPAVGPVESTTVRGPRIGGTCGGSTHPDTPTVGGRCGIVVTGGENIRIQIEDEVATSLAFSVQLSRLVPETEVSSVNEPCAPLLEGRDVLTILVPEGCERMSIRLEFGATVGAVHLARS